MTRILLTADWHIDAVTGGLPRVDEIDPFVEELKEAVIREKVSHLIHMGDFFDPGGMLCSFYTEKVIMIVSDLLAVDRLDTITLLAGNHDVIESSRGTTTISPVAAAFSGEPRVQVFEQPSRFVLTTQPDQIIRGLALPYVARAAYREEAFPEAVKGLSELGDYPLIVVGHMTVPGAVLGSESSDMPRGREIDLPVFELSKLRPVFIANGHYHRAQVTESNVVIPGSPFRFTFGERNDKKKGFTIVEIVHK
jgi:DNA repair exonuclease SbcCD nuclease subunit